VVLAVCWYEECSSQGKFGKVLLLFGVSPHARRINNRVTDGGGGAATTPNPTYPDSRSKDQEGCAVRDGPFVQLWVAEYVIAVLGERWMR
jgi:hypothetical protein